MSQVANLWSPTADASLASPADFDLNIPVWRNEVLAAEYAALFVAKTVRNATPDFASGNLKAKFVVTGRLGTRRHNKGDQIVGGERQQIVREIGLNDRPYIATPLEEENLLRMFEQVNTRADLTTAMGHALAARKEVEVMRRLALAARHANTSDTPDQFRQGGNYYVGAKDGTGIQKNFASNQTGAKNFLAAIEEATLAWTKLSTKRSNRYCFITPELFYEVKKLEVPWDGATATLPGGIFGSTDIVGPKQSFTEVFDVQMPIRYMGVDIYSSNLIDATYDDEVEAFKRDWTGDPDAAGDFSNTVGVIYQSEAVGHVDVMNVKFDVRQNVGRTFNDTVTAMDWTGGGTLKPECAIELVTT